MNPKDILVVGLKGHLSAFNRKTGERLWSTRLKAGMTVDFVSVLADEARAYAHTGGEIFCVDLFTGDGIWSDALPGMGYGLASLALPGTGIAAIPVQAELIRQRNSDSSSSTHTGAH